MMEVSIPLLIGGILLIFCFGFYRGKTSYERWLVRSYNREIAKNARQTAEYNAKNQTT